MARTDGLRTPPIWGEIEDGIPLPPRSGPLPVYHKVYELEVSQSVQVEVTHKGTICSMLSKAQKRTGRKFSYRHIQGRTYRVWRLT